MIEHLVGCPAQRIETFGALRPGPVIEAIITHDAGDPSRPGQPLNDASGRPMVLTVGATAGQGPDVALTIERCIDCGEQRVDARP